MRGTCLSLVVGNNSKSLMTSRAGRVYFVNVVYYVKVPPQFDVR